MKYLQLLIFLLLGFSRAASSATLEHRQVPNYEGRAPEPTSLTEKLLWAPRILFFPVYVVTEYGVRTPLRWLGREAEIHNIPFLVADFFKFGEDNRFAIYPSFLVDFGFRASIGFRFRWKHFLTENNRLNLRAATGGTDYGIVRISDEWHVNPTTFLQFYGEIGRRPDYIFHSIGPMSSKDSRYRYTVVKKEGGTSIELADIAGGSLKFDNAVRSIHFYNSDCCGDPGIENGIRSSAFPVPSRYDTGYTALLQKITINWGNRVTRPTQPIGGTVDGFTQHAFDFSGGGWWNYGGALTGYVDVTGKSRVVSLKADVELSTGHGSRTVPFNEMPALGGNRLVGFLDRRFIGESAFAATAEYKWPVVSKLDGVIQFALGNVFGPDLKGLRWELLRKSLGIGIEATGDKSPPFAVLLAAGSDTFQSGGKFNEMRFLLKLGGGI